MIEPTAVAFPTDTLVSATPFHQTDEYQNLFRTENKVHRTTHFVGVVPPGGKLQLQTNLGDYTDKPALEMRLATNANRLLGQAGKCQPDQRSVVRFLRVFYGTPLTTGV